MYCFNRKKENTNFKIWPNIALMLILVLYKFEVDAAFAT